MVIKQLERKTKIENTEDGGINNPIELNYYLIDNLVEYIPELSGKKFYGIGISKKMCDYCFEEKLVKNFSCCKEDTLNVIYSLADNGVTPTSLEYILDDILGK